MAAADTTPLLNWAPTASLLVLALVLASLPLSWLWLRHQGANLRKRTAALTALALFLTFDLVVFGSFTRLTDSGLGCPDWPGCYGELSPLHARDDIHAAQTAAPLGPVTFTKAWIEMIHRYLAMTVGVLILVLAASSTLTWLRRSPGEVIRPSPVWAWCTLVWVLVQGLFGKYTVTLKLYPLVVTAHLLGGLFLLTLLMLQHEAWKARPFPIGPRTRTWAVFVTAALWLQVALGGWVSTNYAVLACTGFPACNGQWWPDMDWAAGFTFLRALGQGHDGAPVTLEALVAIHMAHRLMAYVVLASLAVLAWHLRREGQAAARRYGLFLGLTALAQLLTGLSNVVLGWPLLAAVLHSAGAAALVALTTSLLARTRHPVPATPVSTISTP